MNITRIINQESHTITLSDKELSLACKEYNIKKMQMEVLHWDLEFSTEDALVIATRAYERFERNSAENRRDCLVKEADKFRKAREEEKNFPLRY